jgi:hypothetical protein
MELAHPKPPLGTHIRWGHPHTRGLRHAFLFNEGSGTVLYDCVGHLKLAMEITGSEPRWVSNAQGKCLIFSFSQLAQDLTYDDGPGQPTNWTFVFGVRPIGTMSGFNTFWGLGGVGIYVNSASFQVYPQAGTVACLNFYQQATMAVTHSGETTEPLNYRVDGNYMSTEFTTLGAAQLVTGSKVGGHGGEYWAGEINFFFIWNRYVGPDTLRQFSRDPFAMFYDE